MYWAKLISSFTISNNVPEHYTIPPFLLPSKNEVLSLKKPYISRVSGFGTLVAVWDLSACLFFRSDCKQKHWESRFPSWKRRNFKSKSHAIENTETAKGLCRQRAFSWVCLTVVPPFSLVARFVVIGPLQICSLNSVSAMILVQILCNRWNGRN